MSRIFVRFKITVSNEIGDLLNPNKVNNIILNFILEVKKDTSPMNIAVCVGGGGGHKKRFFPHSQLPIIKNI